MKLGSTDISKVYLGSTEISKAYLGSTLVHGSDTPLPYDAEVEYLQSSGTQWINTGFNSISANTNFQVSFMNLEGSATGKCVFGSRQAFSTRNVSLWCAADSVGKVRAIKGTYNNPNNYDKSITNADYVSNVSITGREVSWEVNGSTTTWTLPSSTFTSSIPIHVFSLNNNGSPGTSNGWGATIKLYYFKIFTGATLSMDFIPVRKDGVGYLYDKIGGQLFGNSGTGAFTYGNDVTT